MSYNLGDSVIALPRKKGQKEIAGKITHIERGKGPSEEDQYRVDSCQALVGFVYRLHKELRRIE